MDESSGLTQDRLRIEELWNRGLTTSEIAEEMGKTDGAIGQAIYKMRRMRGPNGRDLFDLPARPTGRRPVALKSLPVEPGQANRNTPATITPERLEIEQLWAEGYTVRQIAGELGRTEKAIKRAIDRMRLAPDVWDLPRRWEPYPPHRPLKVS